MLSNRYVLQIFQIRHPKNTQPCGVLLRLTKKTSRTAFLFILFTRTFTTRQKGKTLLSLFPDPESIRDMKKGLCYHRSI